MNTLDACNAIKAALKSMEPLNETATAHGWTISITVSSEFIDYQPSNEYSGHTHTSYQLIADSDEFDACFVASGSVAANAAYELVQQGCSRAMARALSHYVARMMQQQRARLLVRDVYKNERIIAATHEQREREQRERNEREQQAANKEPREFRRVRIPSAWDYLRER